VSVVGHDHTSLTLVLADRPCCCCGCCGAAAAAAAAAAAGISLVLYRLEYITTSTDGSVRVWDGTTHQQLFEFGRGSHSVATLGSVTSAPCRATCAAFSPAGYQIAVGFREGLVRLFDAATTQLLQVGDTATTRPVAVHWGAG
jgi:WD40 repeat protein